MKNRKKWFRVQDLILVLLTVIAVPLLYQNCGDVDFQRFESAVPNAETGIGVEVRNGVGAVVASGGSLCAGGVDATQSRIAVISVATLLSASTYHCRRVSPSADNSFWNCNEARSLGGSSTGGFGVIPGSDDTHAALGYSGLPNGTYGLEISAEGPSGDGSSWTTPAVPVSFVVEDCSTSLPPVTTTPRGAATCSDTNVSQSGSQRFNCGSWLYNGSADGSTNPSYSVCCSCRSDQTGTPPSNCHCPLGQEEYRGLCVNACLEDQVRNSSGQCVDRPVGTFATCGDTNTSQTGSQRFNCGSSSIYNGSAGNRQNPSYQVCCQCRAGEVGTPPNCGCPAGQVKVGQSCVSPTCGDINPSQSGSQRYNCGSGWTYNSSSSNLTNPSRSQCCRAPAATCGDIDPSQSGNQRYNCGSWTYNTSANNFTNPSRSQCCRAPAATCGDIDPSQSGNQTFSCGSFTYKSSSNALGNPSYSVCCLCRTDQIGSPPSSCRCATGKEEYNGLCVDECQSGQVRNAQGQCVTPPPEPVATCGDTDTSQSGSQQFNCGSTSIYNNSASNRQSPSHAVCCLCPSGQVGTPPSCSCPSGQVKVGQSCVSPTCGDRDPSTPGAQKYNCGSWTYNSSSASLTSPSRSRCCTEPEATCADRDPSTPGAQRYNCGSGWTYKSSSASLTSPSRSRCCTQSPGTCADIDPSTPNNQPFSCGSYRNNSSAASSTNLEVSVCCLCPTGHAGVPPNCRCPSGKELFNGNCVNVCPSGQTRNPTTGVCENISCTLTCGDASCDQGVQPYTCTSGTYNSSAAGRTNPSDEVCCRAPQCPAGKVGTPPNCRCPSGKTECNGGCVSQCTGGKELNNQCGCECPSGEEEYNGSCVSVCTGGKERNQQGQCECPSGEVENDSGQCVDPPPPSTPPEPEDPDCPCNQGHLTCKGETYPSTGDNCKTKMCQGSKQPATCEGVSCGSGYQLKDPLPTLACNQTADQNACCERVEETCASVNFQCDPGTIRRGTHQWNNNSPSQSNCCRTTTPDPTCADTDTSTQGKQPYSCPTGMQDKTNSANLTNPSDDVCCENIEEPDCERVDACKNWEPGTVCRGQGLDTFEAGGDFVCYTECEWTLTADDPETRLSCGQPLNERGWRCAASTDGLPDILELCSGDGGNHGHQLDPCHCTGRGNYCEGVRFNDTCGNLACTGSKRC